MPKKKKIVKVMDIVPAKPRRKASAPTAAQEETLLQPKPLQDFDLFTSREESREETFGSADPRYAEDFGEASPPMKERKPRRIRRYVIAGIIVIALLAFGAAKLPKVDIHIVMKKDAVAYDESVFIKTSIGEPNTSAKEIPGEIIAKEVSKVFTFNPTGQTNEEQKATGKIIIHNEFGPATQVLVATTRFEAPDGKIYRLANRVTVPGAPGSIEADIIADKAGPEYNTDGIARLEIPGFEGGSRYGKFYGEITQPVRGGTRGLTPYPTDADIEAAERQAEEQLRGDLKSLVLLQIPKDVMLVDGAERFTLISKNVDRSLTADGKFSVVFEGELEAFVFHEQDVHTFIRELALEAEATDEQSTEKDFTVTYTKPSPQFGSGIMTLPINVQATYWKKLQPDEIKREVANMRELEVKSALLSKDGVDKLSVSFWPFWVSHAPKNINRISVNIE